LGTKIKISLCFLFCISSIYAQQIKKGIVTDIDSNVYKTVSIGKYIWMAENLKTTRYNDGIGIPVVEGSLNWSRLTSAGLSWYDDDKTNSTTYGALYNWYAVNTDKLCPAGWRIPSDEEWKVLEGYVDSLYRIGDHVWDKPGLRGHDAGKRLKAKSGWRFAGNGTDDFGFSALPGGERLTSFNNTKGSSGFWWSSTEDGSANAWYRCMIYSFDEISRDTHPKKMGFSVRCLKNKE
jgi:uncharacterized protein (TIGR02145 family)